MKKKHGDSSRKGKVSLSKKRNRSGTDSSSDSETTLRTQVRRLTEKLKDMERFEKVEQQVQRDAVPASGQGPAVVGGGLP